MTPDSKALGVIRVAAVGLLFLAVVYTLYFAADLLKPVALALFLALLLSPVVRALLRFGIPTTISAGVLVAAVAGVIGMLVSLLAMPAEEWISDAPRTLRELQQEMRSAEGRLGEIQALAEEVDKLANVDEDPEAAQPVVVRGPGLVASLVGGLPYAFAFAISITFLTFFLLAFGNPLMRQAVRWGNTWTVRRRILTITREVQRTLSRYLLTVTVINIGLGCAVTAVMYLLDVPNPLLWGVMTTLFNFAPYVGAVASLAVLTIVGITSFDDLSRALLVPAAFFVLTTIEGQLITPAILGYRMSLSPVIVFVSVLVWGWLWGIIGALIAVPIVCSIVVLCDNLPNGGLIADFLRGGRRSIMPTAVTEPPAPELSDEEPDSPESALRA